jgi:hypothetical protein
MILLNFKLRFEYKILCASIDAGANAISFRKKNKRRPGNTWTHEEGWVTGSARGVQTQLHNQQRSQKDAAVTSGHQTAQPYTSVYVSSAAHSMEYRLEREKEGLGRRRGAAERSGGLRKGELGWETVQPSNDGSFGAYVCVRAWGAAKGDNTMYTLAFAFGPPWMSTRRARPL